MNEARIQSVTLSGGKVVVMALYDGVHKSATLPRSASQRDIIHAVRNLFVKIDNRDRIAALNESLKGRYVPL
jgi:transposase-like protein